MNGSVKAADGEYAVTGGASSYAPVRGGSLLWVSVFTVVIWQLRRLF